MPDEPADDWAPLPGPLPKTPTNAESWQELAKHLRSHLQERALRLNDLPAEQLNYFANACRQALYLEADAAMYARDLRSRRRKNYFESA